MEEALSLFLETSFLLRSFASLRTTARTRLAVDYINEPNLSEEIQGFCFLDVESEAILWVMSSKAFSGSQMQKCRNKPLRESAEIEPLWRFRSGKSPQLST